MAKDNWAKRLKKNVRSALTGKAGHSPAVKAGKKTMEQVTTSRRKLNEAKKQFKETDKKIGERLNTIDKLHNENVRLRGEVKRLKGGKK